MVPSEIAARIRRLELGNLGDVKSGWRRRQRAADRLRTGYCTYFIQQGSTVVILLCGGDKRTQNKDIRTAKRMAKEV
ncbi:type II toxin-antitoxin system RelE/ParE family toxin [Bradyrhizobium jicamae]|uniref:Type II toxin-antitoxin system RelE/ParE family toxin n=1 Tax=Bradyrhizobium jicamae TaxID=280332 RepID=A0ABS5FWI6_9BRAD|nr:type II toxin-antitoxin system RelE/ParE family toxin [Bradyrhizobium jicamae]